MCEQRFEFGLKKYRADKLFELRIDMSCCHVSDTNGSSVKNVFTYEALILSRFIVGLSGTSYSCTHTEEILPQLNF